MRAAISIYDYLDWRAYLRAWLAARPSRSQKRLAVELDCSASFVTALLHEDPERRRALSDEYLHRLCRALSLGSEDAEFLRLLVEYDRAAERSEARDRVLGEIYANRRFRDAHRVTVEQYELFSRWENVAILAMAESPYFRADPRWIRRKLTPSVQVQEAQRALDLLLHLGLLAYDADGRLRPTFAQVAAVAASQEESDAQRAARRLAGLTMHRAMFDRARRVLEEVPAEQRVFNAGTQLVPEELLPELMRLCTRWQAEWMDLCRRHLDRAERSADASRRARVYRMSIQLFPLSEWVGADEDGGGPG